MNKFKVGDWVSSNYMTYKVYKVLKVDNYKFNHEYVYLIVDNTPNWYSTEYIIQQLLTNSTDLN